MTAAHVVDGDPGGVQVRLAGRLWPGEVLWSRRDAAVDAAVVRVSGEGFAEPQGLLPLRWGRLVCAQAGARVEAVGFPRVRMGLDQVRDSEHLWGTLRPLGLAKAGRLDVAVDNPPAATPPSEDSPWAGMSGAGLFCNGVLVGVIARDEAGFVSGRVSAVRLSAFADDPGFTALMWPDNQRAPGLEPAELAPLQHQVPAVASPATLLRADVAVAPFRGRQELLDRLTAWCEEPARMSARLVTGPGGQGKTRLARHFAQLMSHGWATVVLAAHVESEAAAWLASVQAPLLLVVDYAEQRREHLEALGAVLVGRGQSSRVRVLLLARGDGEWRRQLPTEWEFAATSATVVEDLPVLDADLEIRQDAFGEAVGALASRLGELPGLDGMDWTARADGVAPPVWTGPVTALGVQMAALVGLLQAARPVPSTPADTIVDLLNRHEARYWAGVATERGLTLATATQRLAVSACCLLPAATLEQALAVLARTPGVDGLDGDRRMAVASWLRELYPQPGGWWGSLQPDLLAEYLVAATAAEHPPLLPAVLAGADGWQAEQALTVLTRAAVHHPNLTEQITTMIVTRPETLAPAAVKVAVETTDPTPLTTALDTLLSGDGVGLTVLLALHGAIPALPKFMPIAGGFA